MVFWLQVSYFSGAAAHISRIVSNHSLRFGRYLKIPPYSEICFAMPALGARYSDFPFGGNIWSSWMSEQSVQRRNQIFNIFPVQFSHETIINITLRFRSLWALYDTVEVFCLPCSRARNCCVVFFPSGSELAHRSRLKGLYNNRHEARIEVEKSGDCGNVRNKTSDLRCASS